MITTVRKTNSLGILFYYQTMIRERADPDNTRETGQCIQEHATMRDDAMTDRLNECIAEKKISMRDKKQRKVINRA